MKDLDKSALALAEVCTLILNENMQYELNKTLYLLNYIDDEDYRRRVLIQLNRGEGRHAVARVICHGQRGEIRKRYREG